MATAPAHPVETPLPGGNDARATILACSHELRNDLLILQASVNRSLATRWPTQILPKSLALRHSDRDQSFARDLYSIWARKL